MVKTRYKVGDLVVAPFYPVSGVGKVLRVFPGPGDVPGGFWITATLYDVKNLKTGKEDSFRASDLKLYRRKSRR